MNLSSSFLSYLPCFQVDVLLLACGGRGNGGGGEKHFKEGEKDLKERAREAEKEEREEVRRGHLEMDVVRTKEGSAVASNGKVHV